jgi:hypothetical protein
MRDWDFDGQLARALKIAGFMLVFLCFLALLIRPGDPVLLGLGIGIALGMWNAFFLGQRLRAIVGMVAPQAQSHMRAGYALRFMTIVAVLYMASRFDSVNIYAAAAGIFVTPGIFFISTALMLTGPCNKKQERPDT